MKMTLSTKDIGRVVHVIVDPASNNGSDRMPAIITRVHHNNMVNVRPLHDTAGVPSVVASITSLPLYDSEADAQAARANMIDTHTAANDGKAPDLTHVYHGYFPAAGDGAKPATDKLAARVQDLSDRVDFIEGTLREYISDLVDGKRVDGADEKPATGKRAAGKAKSEASETTED